MLVSINMRSRKRGPAKDAENSTSGWTAIIYNLTKQDKTKKEDEEEEEAHGWAIQRVK